MVQATASAQSAAEKISNRTDTVSVQLGDMRTSLRRIKGHQESFADRIEAMESIEAELSDRQLERKLAQMEKSNRPDAVDTVLGRIRKRSKEKNSA